MKIIQELHKFILRGNVIDLAVGVIMGTAFKDIVDSLVKDMLMPPVGLLVGKVDFSNLFFAIDGKDYSSLAAAQQAGAATINYGLFINNIINLLLIGSALFFIIRFVNRLPIPVAPPSASTRECPYCLTKVPKKASKCSACTSELPKLKIKSKK